MHLSPLKFLAVAATAVVTAGCTGAAPDSSGGGGGGGDEGEGTTLTWLIEEPEDAEATQALRDHIAQFEEEAGVTVELETLPIDTMRTVLQTQLRSGEGPDVFNWGSGPSFGGALAEAGMLYDLTEAYEERDWEIYDFAKERVTIDGKIFGIPGEMETIGVYYNKALFEQNGIAEPTSVDELRAASEKLKAAGVIPLAVADKEGWEGGHLLSMALASAIGSDRMDALLSGEASWDSPEVISALALWKEFNEAGYLPESPTSVEYETSEAMFYSGEAAMIPTGSWLVGEIDDNVGVGDEAAFEVGYIPFPAPDGPGVFTAGLGSGPYISANTQNADAAIDFLDFLASEEHGQWTVENLHTIPPRPIDTEALDPEEVSPLLAQVLEDTAKLSEGGDFGQNIDVVMSDAFNEAMLNGIQGIFTGQTTPEEVAANLQAASQA